ncbi:uncharacterized protein [Nicotiana sylvestris]|uniref:uncharacterized protein n=1 Tax=Nicotiana sylvestris TaxID=4096 RepID=UPI00388C5E9D
MAVDSHGKALRDLAKEHKKMRKSRASKESVRVLRTDVDRLLADQMPLDLITSTLKLCGDNISDYDMLEKTFTTFHASNMVLQQQYREKGFTRYSQLISLLLVAERNNELLMRNHENRPTRSTPLPKQDEVYSYYVNLGKGRGHIRGRGHGRGHIQERNVPGVN